MKLDYTKTIDIQDFADVIVVGGGPSGIAAAVSAASLGKRTVLLEQSGALGGSSTLAMVAELMNFDDGKSFVSRGFGERVFRRLGYTCQYQKEWHNVHYEELKRIYDALVKETGVEVMFYTRVVDAVCENNKIKYAVISGPSGLFALQGGCFVDCTGTGSFSCYAGAEYEYGDENERTMSATLFSLWGGVDFARKGVESAGIAQAYKDGVLSQFDNILPGIKANYPQIGVGGGNVGHCFGVDDRDVKSLTEAMFTGRKILAEYENYYRNYVTGCEDAVLIHTANQIGIRESRRIVCEYTLTVEHFHGKESFFDEIGRYSYPVDIHPMTADAEGMNGMLQALSMRHEAGETYSIPYRSLVPKKVDNLLVAGRSFGTDRGMQASARVIPCCYITGQAAGVAAAICAETKQAARDIDIAVLQRYIAELCNEAENEQIIY